MNKGDYKIYNCFVSFLSQGLMDQLGCHLKSPLYLKNAVTCVSTVLSLTPSSSKVVSVLVSLSVWLVSPLVSQSVSQPISQPVSQSIDHQNGVLYQKIGTEWVNASEKLLGSQSTGSV